MKSIATAFALAALLVVPANAAGEMTESQAKAAAVKILMGDPYGKTAAAVLRNIESAQLITAGTACGAAVKKPVWQFQVRVPKERNPSGSDEISGYLVIDGRSGKLVCAGLPFLS